MTLPTKSHNGETISPRLLKATGEENLEKLIRDFNPEQKDVLRHYGRLLLEAHRTNNYNEMKLYGCLFGDAIGSYLKG